MKRIFIIVLDSFGIGEAPDAADFGDEGSNTIYAVSKSSCFNLENLEKLGLFDIDGVQTAWRGSKHPPVGTYARMTEASMGKDTTIGHWEISGIISRKPLPTYPHGFPKDVIERLEKETGKKVLCNRTYSGTDVIRDYGKQQMEEHALIVYTSADSVLQIAAHEQIIPPEELYGYCKIARNIMTGEYGVGRIIARPFIGSPGNFTRTSNRHDFSLEPPKNTMLDALKEHGFDVIGIGKIHDIFAGRGLTQYEYTTGNDDGIAKTKAWMDRDFEGLCFVNLVDFDMLYGHRNDVDGYASALTSFDQNLPDLIGRMREEDLLMITADHGCDPSTVSTDHSREYVPWIMYRRGQIKGKNLGTLQTFADIGASVLQYFSIDERLDGTGRIGEAYDL